MADEAGNEAPALLPPPGWCAEAVISLPAAPRTTLTPRQDAKLTAVIQAIDIPGLEVSGLPGNTCACMHACPVCRRSMCSTDTVSNVAPLQ
jgi:hypothetical protein